MRLPKRALGPAGQRCVTGDRLNRCDFQRFTLIQRRQKPWKPTGEQRLAGTGWPAEQQVMRARCRDQQSALGSRLALNFTQVRVRLGLQDQAVGFVGGDGGVAVEVGYQLKQVTDRDHLQSGSQAGFFSVYRRDNQRMPCFTRCQCGRQHTLLGFVRKVGAGRLPP